MSSSSFSTSIRTRSTTGIPYEFHNSSCSPYNITVNTVLTVQDLPNDQQDIQLLRCGNTGVQYDLVVHEKTYDNNNNTTNGNTNIAVTYRDITLPPPSTPTATGNDNYVGTYLPLRTLLTTSTISSSSAILPATPGEKDMDSQDTESQDTDSTRMIQQGLLVAYSFIIEHYGAHCSNTNEGSNLTSSSTPNPFSSSVSPVFPCQWIFQGRHRAPHDDNLSRSSSSSSLWHTLDERTLSSSYWNKVNHSATNTVSSSSSSSSMFAYPWTAYVPSYRLNTYMDEYRIVVRDIMHSEGNHSKKYPGYVYISKVRLYYANTIESVPPSNTLSIPPLPYPLKVDWYWQLFMVGPSHQRRLRLISSDHSIDVLTSSFLYLPANWTATVRIDIRPLKNDTNDSDLCTTTTVDYPQPSLRIRFFVDEKLIPLIPYAALREQWDCKKIEEVTDLIVSVPSIRFMDRNTNDRLSIVIGQDCSSSSSSTDSLSSLSSSFHPISPRQLTIAYDAPLMIKDTDKDSPFIHHGFEGFIHRLDISSSAATDAETDPPSSPVLSTPYTLQTNNQEYTNDRTLCLPIHTLEHVLLWNPPEIYESVSNTTTAFLAARRTADSSLRSNVPLRTRFRHPSNQHSLTLICHDCGPSVYKEDNHVDGIHDSSTCASSLSMTATGSTLPTGHMYRFENWAYCDIFVYFSHERVSIPPIGWINACHRNGTRILGTIITEWSDGENANLLFTLPYTEPIRTTLSSPNSSLVAYKLTEIAVYYGFDGWLVNIEATVDNGKDGVQYLTRFLSDLTTFVHTMLPTDGNATNTGGLVLWYDSVHANTGNVQWQSELNTANEIFLQHCDGIFLDYHWNKSMVQNTLHYRSRLTDRSTTKPVFVGIDMWGRGTYGGGGWNTLEAVKLIKDLAGTTNDLSMALFGPAWTYEAMKGMNDSVFFRKLEQRMWQGKAMDNNDNDTVRLSVPVINPNGILPDIPLSIRESALHNDKFLQQQLQLYGWIIPVDTVKNNSQGWSVVTDEEAIPMNDGDEVDSNESTKSCFVTSHKWCWASQTVPLSTTVPPLSSVLSDPNEPTVNVSIEFSEWYKGSGPNYEDQYQCKVSLLNGSGTVIEEFQHTSTVLTCTDTWKKYTFIFPKVPIPNPLYTNKEGHEEVGDNLVTTIKVEHGGKDIECWAGHFGARMKGTRIMIVIDKSVTTSTVQASSSSTNTLAVSTGLIGGIGAPNFLTLPIHTSFNTGIGSRVYKNGTLVHAGAWSNLSNIELLPAFMYHHARVIPSMPLSVDDDNVVYQRYSSLTQSTGSTFLRKHNYVYHGLEYDQQIAWNGGTSLIYGTKIPIKPSPPLSSSTLRGSSLSSMNVGYDQFRLFPVYLPTSSNHRIQVTVHHDILLDGISANLYDVEYTLVPIVFSYDTSSTPLLPDPGTTVSEALPYGGWYRTIVTLPCPSNNFTYSVVGIHVGLRIQTKDGTTEISLSSVPCLVRLGYMAIETKE